MLYEDIAFEDLPADQQEEVSKIHHFNPGDIARVISGPGYEDIENHGLRNGTRVVIREKSSMGDRWGNGYDVSIHGNSRHRRWVKEEHLTPHGPMSEW